MYILYTHTYWYMYIKRSEACEQWLPCSIVPEQWLSEACEQWEVEWID